MNLLIKVILILFTGFIINNTNISAQEKTSQYMIMGVPQYIIDNGIRIDIDMQTSDTRNWWVFAPQYYIDLNGDHFIRTHSKQMHGIGLLVYRKAFLSKKYTNKGFYLSVGLGYQYFDLLNNDGYWTNFNDDGLNYYQLSKSDTHVYINKVLTDGIIGYQFELIDHLYSDIFIGFGLRYSINEQLNGTYTKYNSNVFDYGYTGTTFIVGMRFGVAL
jgi:hypothetical protein